MQSEPVHVEPVLLSKSEFARRVSLSVRTVERLIQSGELSFVRVRRRILVPASQTAKFLAAARKEVRHG